MRASRFLWLIPLLMATTAPAQTNGAGDTVTIPKSRLEELQRKAAELDRLKGELNKTQGEKQQLESDKARLQAEQEQLKKARQDAEAKAAEARAAAAAAAAAKTESVIQHNTPPMTALPPLRKDEVVDAMDLMNHFRANATAAGKRYGAQRIRVTGEVTGFEKPLLVSYYVIYLKTTESRWKVACHVYPPRTYSSAYTINGGNDMVGSTPTGSLYTLAKVGQTVVVEGQCTGLHNQVVAFSSCSLVSAK